MRNDANVEVEGEILYTDDAGVDVSGKGLIEWAQSEGGHDWACSTRRAACMHASLSFQPRWAIVCCRLCILELREGSWDCNESRKGRPVSVMTDWEWAR